MYICHYKCILFVLIRVLGISSIICNATFDRLLLFFADGDVAENMTSDNKSEDCEETFVTAVDSFISAAIPE